MNSYRAAALSFFNVPVPIRELLNVAVEIQSHQLAVPIDHRTARVSPRQDDGDRPHLDAEGPLELAPTFLGAHAIPPEYKDEAAITAAYVVIPDQLLRDPVAGIYHNIIKNVGLARFAQKKTEKIQRGVTNPTNQAALLAFRERE